MITQVSITVSPDELRNIIRDSVKEILDDNNIIKSRSPNHLMDVKGAAAYLGISVSTLYDKTHQKLIPHAKQGKKLYFKQTDLEDYVNDGRVKTKDEISKLAEQHLASLKFSKTK